MFKIGRVETEDVIGKAQGLLVRAIVKHIGRSFDIGTHEDGIMSMSEYKALDSAYYTPWGGSLPFISIIRSLDGFSYSKNQRVSIITACDLFLFDIVKK